jgi:hypothetical protein
MLTAARKHYDQQQSLSALAVRQLRRTTGRTRILERLAVYQATAALLAAEHGEAALREQEIPAEGAELVATAFTVSPAAPSVIETVKTQFEFDRIVASLVSDAGRSAMGAFTASRRREVGNIRVLTPPSCSRCAILAGRYYRWSEGFKRHPQCDCTMVPGTEAAGSWDPNGAYERGEIGTYRTMPDGSRRFEQGLTKAQRQAVDDGADITQVVNANRGLQTVNFAGRPLRVTTEGTTSRGLAYSSLAKRGSSEKVSAGYGTRLTASGPETRAVTKTVARAPRLSPEAIYRVSEGNRDTAVRLLRANGYIL